MTDGASQNSTAPIAVCGPDHRAARSQHSSVPYLQQARRCAAWFVQHCAVLLREAESACSNAHGVVMHSLRSNARSVQQRRLRACSGAARCPQSLCTPRGGAGRCSRSPPARGCLPSNTR